eukprot:COSAG02_NODE_3652_length_6414_cov_10.240222_8_plen_22_part_01
MKRQSSTLTGQNDDGGCGYKDT